MFAAMLGRMEEVGQWVQVGRPFFLATYKDLSCNLLVSKLSVFCIYFEGILDWSVFVTTYYVSEESIFFVKVIFSNLALFLYVRRTLYYCTVRCLLFFPNELNFFVWPFYTSSLTPKL